MRPQLQILALIGFLVVCGGLVLALRPNTEPSLPHEAPRLTRSAAPSRPPPSRPVPQAPPSTTGNPVAPPEGTSPAGWAFRGDRPRPNSTAGEVEPLPPASPEIWRARRQAMAESWRKEALEVARRFGEEHLGASDRQHVLDVLAAMHDELEAIRAELEAGDHDPATARAEMRQIREETARALVERIGGRQTAALRARLQDGVRGGGF